MKPEQLMPKDVYQASVDFRNTLQSIVSLEGNIVKSVGLRYGTDFMEKFFEPIFGGQFCQFLNNGQLEERNFYFLCIIVSKSDEYLIHEALTDDLTDCQNAFLFIFKPHLRKRIFGSDTEIYKPDLSHILEN